MAIRSRHWKILLYPSEDPSHSACLSLLSNGEYSFVAIEHNKDVALDDEFKDDGSLAYHKGDLKKSHHHVVLSFPNPRYQNAVAEELGIKPNYLKPITDQDDGGRNGAILYLIHDGIPSKYQYSASEAFGPLKRLFGKLLRSNDENARVIALMELIYSYPHMLSLKKLILLACENEMYGDLRRMGSWVKDLIEDHNCELNELPFGRDSP